MYSNTPKPNNTRLILILGIEIILIITLIIPIILINTNKPTEEPSSNSVSTSSSENEYNDEESEDNRPDCKIEITKDEPFSNIKMDYPYAGVYESTGKYICNTDLGYAVAIPKDISKVYYYIINGGQIGILGLKTNGEVMANQLSFPTSYAFESAGILNTSTEKTYQQSLEADPASMDAFTVVFKDATSPLQNYNSSNSEEARQLMISLYGEENPRIYILYQQYINPKIFEESPDYANAISAEMLNQLKEDYENRNQELNNIIDKIFGNPDNYHKAEAESLEQNN